MFVASRVYNYATGANATVASTASSSSTPANTRVKRHPRKVNGKLSQATSSSHASVVAGQSGPGSKQATSPNVAASNGVRSPAELAKIAIIDEIVSKDDLYEVLGVKRNAKSEDIRRGFLNRSRTCHPDKLPNYEPCVYAFQKVSFAYQTLSKPSSRRLYDVSGRSDLAAALNENGSMNDVEASGLANDETLNGVLYSVFCEFLEGDFEMIRVLVNALNEGNPGLDLGDDAVDSIEGAFRRLRELMLAGKKYLSVIRFELIRLYEIQHSLRQLSYFDIFGRLRLTLQLARVTLSIPMAIDQAMKEPDEGLDAEERGTKRGTGERENGWNSDKDDPDDEQDGHSSDGHGSDSSDTTAGEFDLYNEAANDRDSRTKSTPQDQRHHKSFPEEEEEFGMRADDDEQDDTEDARYANVFATAAADDDGAQFEQRQRRASRRARRQARLKERRRAKLEAKEAQSSLQRRGLLGPTAAGLLKGVVKVLETSESWVPGSSGGSNDRDSDRAG